MAGQQVAEQEAPILDEEGLGGNAEEPGVVQQELNDYMLTRDRARRIPKPSSRYSEAEYLLYALCVAEKIEYVEPSNFQEAMKSK